MGTTTMLAAGEEGAIADAVPPAGSRSLLSGEAPVNTALVRDDASVELGVRFQVEKSGRILGLRLYRVSAEGSTHRGTLWDSRGQSVGSLSFPATDRQGWQYVSFTRPLDVAAGSSYVASYHTSNGYLAEREYFGAHAGSDGQLSLTEDASRYLYGNSVAVPTRTYRGTNYWIDPVFLASTVATPDADPNVEPDPAAPAPIAYPGPSNTGVPDGVSLSDYTGPMTITTAGTILDSKRIRGTLVIAASGVTVRRSQILGNVDSDRSGASVRIEDSEVDAGTDHVAAVGYGNISILRSDLHGGQHSVLCGTNCRVEKSWLHDQHLPIDEPWHNQAYLSNGGHGVQLVGNTFQCTPRDNAVGGGCTGDVAFFGDFSAIYDVSVTNNLFKSTPGGYCATFGYNANKPYGQDTRDITVVDNVFEAGSGGKCGYWGPVTGVPSDRVFENNRYVDGRLIAPAR